MSVHGLTEDRLTVGDEVLVWSGYYHQRERALDPYPGRIVKVARTLVTVAVTRDGRETEWVFRIDGQAENVDRGQPGRFRTIAQAAEEQRRTVALARLAEFGLAPSTGSIGGRYRPLRIDTDTLVRMADLLPEAVPE